MLGYWAPIGWRSRTRGCNADTLVISDFLPITDYVNFVAAHSATAYSNDVEWPAT